MGPWMNPFKMLKNIITGRFTLKQYVNYFLNYYIFWLFGKEDEW